MCVDGFRVRAAGLFASELRLHANLFVGLRGRVVRFAQVCRKIVLPMFPHDMFL